MNATPDIVAPVERIPVKEEDIAAASPQDQFKCAIVRAIQRIHPEATRVCANKKAISWTEGEQRFVYVTPQIAIDAIITPLDTGGTPEPLTLRLTDGYVKPRTYREPERQRKHREDSRNRAKRENWSHHRNYEREGV